MCRDTGRKLHTEMQERINQFVLDASRVSGDLDRISVRDRPEVRALAVKTGADAYAELVERQRSLALTYSDARHLQIIMDGIRARLKFLG